MKAKVTVLVIIGIILTSCGVETVTPEIKVVTKALITQAPATQEPISTEEVVAFVATEPPAAAPTEPALACVTLLAPKNGVDLPVTGKVTFSWTKMDRAGSYVLKFILPSGQTTSFEIDQISRDRYMEAFVSGGKYQWQVIAQDENGSEICVSEAAAFTKPTYQQQKSRDSNSGNGGDDSSGGVTGGQTGGNTDE